MNPRQLAWKANALPTELLPHSAWDATGTRLRRFGMMGGEGFEPPQALPTDLQSAPVDHLGIRPLERKLARGFEPPTK